MCRFNIFAWCVHESPVISIVNPMLFPCKLYAFLAQKHTFADVNDN